MRRLLTALLALSLSSLIIPMARAASPRERVFTGFAGDRVFEAAVKAARENFTVTSVDKRHMAIVFHADVTLGYNFDWNASVVKTQGGVKLVVTVPGQPDVLASSTGGRIAEQLFEATEKNLMKEDTIECRVQQPHPAEWKYGG